MRTALICVLIAGLMPYLWTAVAKVLGPRYDNRNVREWQSRLTGMAQRAHAAHLNSFEAFPFFAVAVVAAVVAHAEMQRVCSLWKCVRVICAAYGFLVSREPRDLARPLLASWRGLRNCDLGFTHLRE
jgi:uncharacterized MAPEG superfamily protein